jgi:hypothetical protein
MLVLVTLCASAEPGSSLGRIAGLSCFFVGVTSALAVVVFLIIRTRSRGTVCPECGRMWARLFVVRKVVEEKKCFGLVTRYAQTNSVGWRSGTSHQTGGTHSTSYGGPVFSSGATSWQERVPVIRTTYEEHYQCKYCVAEFVEERIKEVEDFNVERE